MMKDQAIRYDVWRADPCGGATLDVGGIDGYEAAEDYAKHRHQANGWTYFVVETSRQDALPEMRPGIGHRLGTAR